MKFVKKLVTTALVVICLTGCENKKTTNENNSSNDNSPKVAINFSDAQNNPSDYEKYEGKIIEVTNVPIWKTEDDVTFGKLTYAVSCNNKDNLDLTSLEDGSEVSLTGKLTYTSTLGLTIDNCTIS